MLGSTDRQPRTNASLTGWARMAREGDACNNLVTNALLSATGKGSRFLSCCHFLSTQYLIFNFRFSILIFNIRPIFDKKSSWIIAARTIFIDSSRREVTPSAHGIVPPCRSLRKKPRVAQQKLRVATSASARKDYTSWRQGNRPSPTGVNRPVETENSSRLPTQ